MKLFKFKVSFKKSNAVSITSIIYEALIDYVGKFIAIKEEKSDNSNIDFVWFSFLVSAESTKELEKVRKDISSIYNFDVMTLPTELRSIDYIESKVL